MTAPGQPPAEDATSRAARLVELLAARNIPATDHLLPGGIVVVSIYAGLVARVTDVAVWWPAPNLTATTSRIKISLVYTVEAAAVRLANDYHTLRSVPLADLLTRGVITPLAAALLGHAGDPQPAPIR